MKNLVNGRQDPEALAMAYFALWQHNDPTLKLSGVENMHVTNINYGNNAPTGHYVYKLVISTTVADNGGHSRRSPAPVRYDVCAFYQDAREKKMSLATFKLKRD
ncbi:hypothetical protein CASFOL_027974 [Castilleja foliolosa]|uniref:Cysteine proteinase inhibitor n=1 Tax=Castilleja foliolosa TaxID=1961234 RepID=A0ABD3CGC4_9LAMI